MSEQFDFYSHSYCSSEGYENSEFVESAIGTHRHFVDVASKIIPEISDEREGITRAGEELIARYNIAPTFFSDNARSLFFSAIANRFAKSIDQSNERMFLTNALTVLAHEFSPELDKIYVQDMHQWEGVQYSDDYILQVINRYKEPITSAEMQTAIACGLLGETKSRLQITEDNEEPYEVWVLSASGISDPDDLCVPLPPKFGNVEDMPNDPNERPRFHKQGDDLWDDIIKWKRELAERQNKLSQEISLNKINEADAWMISVAERKIICVPLFSAEKILHPEVTQYNVFYSETDRAENLYHLRHEYTHTQGGIGLPDGWGIAFEELRAELYSGADVDKLAYAELKTFADDLWIATGYDVLAYMDRTSKGGDAFTLYTELANNVGLDRILDLALVHPAIYAVEGSKIQQCLDEYLGGYDDVLRGIVEDRKSLAPEEVTLMKKRIDVLAQSIIARQLSRSALETYFEYREEEGFMLFTDRLKRAVKKIAKAS